MGSICRRKAVLAHSGSFGPIMAHDEVHRGGAEIVTKVRILDRGESVDLQPIMVARKMMLEMSDDDGTSQEVSILELDMLGRNTQESIVCRSRQHHVDLERQGKDSPSTDHR